MPNGQSQQLPGSLIGPQISVRSSLECCRVLYHKSNYCFVEDIYGFLNSVDEVEDFCLVVVKRSSTMHGWTFLLSWPLGRLWLRDNINRDLAVVRSSCPQPIRGQYPGHVITLDQ